MGERGQVLLSDDYGRNWWQVEVPTRATLTAVWFATAQLDWAVGHDNVILHTRDGGLTWGHQYATANIGNRFLDMHFLDEQRG